MSPTISRRVFLGPWQVGFTKNEYKRAIQAEQEGADSSAKGRAFSAQGFPLEAEHELALADGNRST